MGCFLACFGFDKKKKRRKPGKRSFSGEDEFQNRGRYVPLDSDASAKLEIKENHFGSDSCQLKEKTKGSKIKKKVSFNLNVKAYEPIPSEDDISLYISDGEEETNWEFNTETNSMDNLHYEVDSDASHMMSHSHPASYRYRNCRDGYEDEDEEIKFEENDLNFDDIEDGDDEVDDVYSKESDDGMPSPEDFPWDFNTMVVESADEVTTNQISDENRSLESLKSSFHARDRSQYVISVLNPVENLTQWKAVKGKAAKPQLKRQKENLMLLQEGQKHSTTKSGSDASDFKEPRNPNVSQPSEHTIAVDVSLSNWLGSLGSETITKNSGSGQDRNTTDI